MLSIANNVFKLFVALIIQELSAFNDNPHLVIILQHSLRAQAQPSSDDEVMGSYPSVFRVSPSLVTFPLGASPLKEKHSFPVK